MQCCEICQMLQGIFGIESMPDQMIMTSSTWVNERLGMTLNVVLERAVIINNEAICWIVFIQVLECNGLSKNKIRRNCVKWRLSYIVCKLVNHRSISLFAFVQTDFPQWGTRWDVSAVVLLCLLPMVPLYFFGERHSTGGLTWHCIHCYPMGND